MNSKILLLFIALLLFSCTHDNILDEGTTDQLKLDQRFNELPLAEFTLNTTGKRNNSVRQFMTSVNSTLASQGLPIQMSSVEYLNNDGAGNTVFFEDRGNRQLTADFVPGDVRRGGFDDIAYALDGLEGPTSSGLSQADTDGAILSAMNTWNNVSCSAGLELVSLGSSPFDLGYVEALVTGGAQGSFFFTDLMHSGFNTTVTDAVFGPGSSVLGVTFTFTFRDADGNETDIDNNKKSDVAFRDIYYNDSFSWAIGDNVDVETVALHETGHGLSQAHFGKLFQSNGNGEFHFAPRAVMNAGYTGIQRSIGATDKAGHCSNWGAWPNK